MSHKHTHEQLKNDGDNDREPEPESEQSTRTTTITGKWLWNGTNSRRDKNGIAYKDIIYFFRTHARLMRSERERERWVSLNLFDVQFDSETSIKLGANADWKEWAAPGHVWRARRMITNMARSHWNAKRLLVCVCVSAWWIAELRCRLVAKWNEWTKQEDFEFEEGSKKSKRLWRRKRERQK